MKDIFVYGTLQFHEVVSALTGKNFNSKKAVLKDHKIYQIDPRDKTGMCPAAIPEKGSFIEGRILFDVDEESFNKIDFFESNKYTKQELIVEAENKEFKALVFVWKDSLKAELKGPWSKEEFEKKYLDNCLKNTIPEVLKKYNSNNSLNQDKNH